MKTTLVALVAGLVLVGALGPAIACAGEPSRMNQSIDIAEAIAISDKTIDPKGRPQDLQLVLAKLYSSVTNEITGATKSDKELTAKLTGEIYWLIYYRSRFHELGGDVGVLINAMTGRVIHVYRGR
jgi:hypothetical protein